MRKSCIAVLLIAAVSLMLLSCSSLKTPVQPDVRENPKYTIRLATAFATGHILNDYCLKFKEIINSNSQGKIDVEFLSASGTEEAINIQCSQGVVDMQATGGYPLQVFAPQYFFFNAPYVIKDYDHFLRVWNGTLGKDAQKIIKKDGNMIGLGTVYRGLRQMTSNKPIYGPADLVALKLRLPSVPIWKSVWEALETSPVTVTLPNLYNALASGAAEASEGDLAQIYSYRLYEVQSHLTLTNHLLAVGWIMINKNFMDNLPEHYQEMIKVASQQACEYATNKMKSNEQNYMTMLQQNNMTIVTPDAEAIRQKAKPTIENLFQTQWPVTTWEEVLAQ